VYLHICFEVQDQAVIIDEVKSGGKMIDVERLFGGIGNGKTRPDYDAIAKELTRLKNVNNCFFSTYLEKETALADTGKIATGLFNRAAMLDGEDPDRWD